MIHLNGYILGYVNDTSIKLKEKKRGVIKTVVIFINSLGSALYRYKHTYIHMHTHKYIVR